MSKSRSNKPGEKHGEVTLVKSSYCPRNLKLVSGKCVPDYKKIQVYDNDERTFDRYTVVTSTDVFSMSHNALAPNGVNMWLGERSTFPNNLRHLGRRLTETEIPNEIKKAIWERLKEG